MGGALLGAGLLAAAAMFVLAIRPVFGHLSPLTTPGGVSLSSRPETSAASTCVVTRRAARDRLERGLHILGAILSFLAGVALGGGALVATGVMRHRSRERLEQQARAAG